MKRKLITALMCVVMSLSLLPMNAFAVEQVEYLDESGEKPKLASYNVIDSNTTNWTEGWYIADSEVTIPARAEVSGNVNLVLIDGCKLTVKNGIHVPAGASLTIYAQSTGEAGTLTVTNGDWRIAAIGGNFNENSGKITINGGNIHAEYGMGIGHGYDAADRTSGEVVINGGNIDASGINGSSGSSVMISAPAGYAMAVRTGDDKRIEGSPFVSTTDINDVLKGGAVHIRQVPNAPHTINVETNGNGTVSANPTSTVAEDAVQLTATPASYYHFKEWQSEDVTISTNNTFIMPDKDVTVKAIFEHDSDIPYMDEKGETKYLATEDVTIFTSDMTILSNTWYLIDGEFTIEDRLRVNGDVNMILADGCKLTLKNGINVDRGDGYCNNLTIYAQSTDKAGTIVATTNNFGAAIGGGSLESSGQITINGGIINATALNNKGGSSSGAAAIGGGDKCGKGYVTINNGDITAESWYGAAIGGGNTKDDASRTLPEARGYVTINGGTIKATAHLYGAAIGGGEKSGSEVTINGGNITARGYDDAVGIGGAYSNDRSLTPLNFNSKITISGGVIDVKTERGKAFVVGSGGWFKADLPKGYAIDARTGKNLIELNDSPFLSGDIYEALGSWTDLRLTVGPYHSITYTLYGNGKFDYVKKHTIALKGTRVSFYVFPDDHNHFVSCTSKEVQLEDHGPIKSFTMPETDVAITVTFEQDQVTYLDDSGNEQTTKDYTELKEDMNRLEDGWYAVWDTVTIPKRIETSGDVHLILMDGCNLEAQGGIHVGPDSSLTIYSQSTGEDAGSITTDLRKTGTEKTWNCAPIGGNDQERSGQITINGGNITVATDDGAAGIGGGSGDRGKVTVNNGNVTATTKYGAGIGGGNGSHILSTVIINGGDVNGESTKGGAGIGGGNQGDAGVTINGGTVRGKGYGNGSGIGGGNKGNGIVLITGGIIDGISESSEGIMAGKIGKITISPQEGSSIAVKVGDVAIEGSPFTEEKDIGEKLQGKKEVHIEEYYESGGSGDLPSTGDRNNALPWILLMLGAGLVFAGSMLYDRRKKQ